jgi:hypothetical protein
VSGDTNPDPSDLSADTPWTASSLEIPKSRYAEPSRYNVPVQKLEISTLRYLQSPYPRRIKSFRMVKVLYIAGSGRSGSTILDLAIGQHPKCFSAGELRQLWTYSIPNNEFCGCGVPFNRCSFWTQVMNTFQAEITNYKLKEIARLKHKVKATCLLAPISSRLLKRQVFENRHQYGQIMLRLYRAIQSISGKDIIIDSSKNLADLCCIANTRGIDLKVVHLVRDGRGVAFSWSKKIKFSPLDVNSGTHLHRYSPIRSSIKWVLLNTQLEIMKRSMNLDTITITYEEFVRNPEQILSKIFSFLDLKCRFTVTPSARILNATNNHCVSGNPVRFQKGLTKLRPDTQWKQNMRLADRLLSTAISLPLLMKYGYLSHNNSLK